MISSLTQTFSKIDEVSKKVGTAYDTFIREKAIELVNEKLVANKIDIQSVDTRDYEAMVSDSCKDIKEKYYKHASQGLMVIMGIDFLLG